jgi:hypothetical protein
MVATAAPHTASICEGGDDDGDGDTEEGDGARLRRCGNVEFSLRMDRFGR